jgi:hypothetical protein
LGDNLVAGAPLRSLKRMGYMCEVITSEMCGVVYQHNPFIDKLTIKNVERDIPNHNDQKAWQAWIESRAKEYDVFIHASHSLEGRHSLFQGMSSFWWPADYRRKVCAGSYIETAHDIAGVPYEFGPLFFASDEERKYARETKSKVGERCILWVISGSRIDKMYPYATTAIARIIKEVGAPVVVMGGPSEKETSSCELIKEVVTHHNGTRDGLHIAVPAAGGEKCWPVRTSLAVALECDLVITPDTGPWWAVAFEPMPKILMLSHGSVEGVAKHAINTTVLHADPDRVPCWPCHKLHDTIDTCVVNKDGNGAACISDISVERLVSIVADVWRNGRNVIHAERAFARNEQLPRAL